MGQWLIGTLCVVACFSQWCSLFAVSAPLEISNDTPSQWKINTENNKCHLFNDANNEKWKDPFFFIQGADCQFGLISRYILHEDPVTWEREKELAEALVSRINQMNPLPKFFVICGDLCDAVPPSDPLRPKQDEDFKAIFGKVRAEIPVLCVCGNHDVGDIPTSESITWYRERYGDDYYSFLCGGLMFMVINSQYFFNSTQSQEYARKHEQWIDDTLEVSKAKGIKRIIIFQHIPWFLKDVDEPDHSYYTIRGELRKNWLPKFKAAGVEAIFCGHYHRNSEGAYEGLPVVTTSAIGGQLGDDKSGVRIVKVYENSIGNNKTQDEPVEELENLKKMLESVPKKLESAKEVSVSKSRTAVFTDVNGERKVHKESNDQVNKDGQLIAKVSHKTDAFQEKNTPGKSHTLTEIEIPSEGIHRKFEKEEENADVTNQDSYFDSAMRKLNSVSGMEYSPLDMAEYVFWTGDEKGVTLAIEDFLQEGLMSREDAINYLQSIKSNLDYIQAHYQGLKKMEEKITSKLQHQLNDDSGNEYQEKSRHNLMSTSNARSSQYSANLMKAMEREIMKEKEKRRQSAANEDYEEMLEKVKGFDYKDYTMEEVIYELAKVMFSQSLSQGSKEAQTALRRFTDYLEKEVYHGRISRELEKKILGVLLSALSDTLSERPELLAAANEGLSNMNMDRPLSGGSRHHVLKRRSLYLPEAEYKQMLRQANKGAKAT